MRTLDFGGEIGYCVEQFPVASQVPKGETVVSSAQEPLDQQQVSAVIQKVVSRTEGLTDKERNFTLKALRSGALSSPDHEVQGYAQIVCEAVDRTEAGASAGEPPTMTEDEFDALVEKLRSANADLSQREIDAIVPAFYKGVSRAEQPEVAGYVFQPIIVAGTPIVDGTSAALKPPSAKYS